jgi:mannose-1-phosphate guanylyltransferase/mannose-6-phosphate isomerase
VLVVTPADQAIVNLNALQKSLQKAIHAASDGSLVILGVKPIAPETGYGYIRTNKISDKDSAYLVEEFAEKPDIQTAKLYFDSGDYVWNSGMFVFKASAWLKALKFFSPDIFYLTSKSFEQSKCDGKFVRPDADVFLKIPSDSVDYAVLEKCQGTDYKIKMIELDAGWNDLGAWDAVWQMSDKDNNRNVFHGDVLTHNSKNSLVHASHRLVGVVGLENVLVVETADAVLVANRHSAQQVKEIVEKLKCSKREEHILHRKVNRPWGWYDTLDFGPRFKVKRILVNPGGKLSLQKHAKRAEHWIVVRGKAQVICEDNHFILNENESTFIPLGLLHRLSNPFDEPLEIIEVQSGSYLGEDDIQRFDDCYGREGRGA